MGMRARGVDSRAPMKLHYQELGLGAVSVSIPNAFDFKSHFRGAVVGVQLSASTVVASGTIQVVITDLTTGIVLLNTGALTVPMANPYTAEVFASGISFLPPTDSQLDQLPLISQGNNLEIDVIVGGGLSVTNLIIMPEYMGRE